MGDPVTTSMIIAAASASTTAAVSARHPPKGDLPTPAARQAAAVDRAQGQQIMRKRRTLATLGWEPASIKAEKLGT